MSGFLRLKERKQEVITSYFLAKRAAEDNREKEHKATLRIQCCYRGFAKRKKFKDLTAAAILIQKVYRGYRGRIKCEAERAKKKRQERLAFYNHFAILIQRIFRGYYSRKYIHDYHARKAYIVAVLEKNVKLRNILQEESEKQATMLEEESRRKLQQEFEEVASNLHHLISTKSIPGVYKPPHRLYGSEETIFNTHIEDHLREAVKGLTLRQKQASNAAGTTMVSTANLRRDSLTGTWQPLPPPPRTSIQASSKYSILEDTKRLEKKLDKMTRISSQDFVVRKPDPLPHQAGIGVGTQYGERLVWREENKQHRVADKDFVSAVGSKPLFDKDATYVSSAAPGRRRVP